ncbi:MAG TPA: MotA/TolQ/ExbB proton channel family protein [Myxococcota bacterium]|nr:MotA/TolQ/ExbB proton channel family protein [Myxococcota bacterium]
MGIIAGTALGGRLASIDALSLVWQASWLVQLVIGLLALSSVISWAIILAKWRELRRAEQDSEAFLEVYQEGSLDAAYQLARNLDRSPLASMFVSAYAEFNRMTRFGGKGKPAALSESQLRALERQLGWAGSREGLRLERGLSFLATTGSAAPFIGLFGTVVGIINAFHGIGQAGTASLAVVAPGIAEALIATAIGLFAAIPATIFYNHFVGELRGLTAAIDLFAADCESDLRRYSVAPDEPVRVAQG